MGIIFSQTEPWVSKAKVKEEELAEEKKEPDPEQGQESLDDEEKKTTDKDDDNFGGGVHPARQVFNIVNNNLGEGMLSLPAAMSKGTGIIPGILICLLMYGLSLYTFSAIGRISHSISEKHYSDMGSRLWCKYFGIFTTLVCLAKTFCLTLAYMIAISELGRDILLSISGIDLLPDVLVSRQSILLAFLSFVLLPLCLIRDMSNLSLTSVIGVIAELGVVGFMTLRFVDASYKEGGEYYYTVNSEHRPFFPGNTINIWGIDATTLVLANSLTTAFVMHFNAPKFYYTLRNPSVGSFNCVSIISFTICLIVYIWAMLVGYLTFGVASNGLILNNYSTHDGLATVARIGLLFAIVFGFPLIFTGLRDSSIGIMVGDPEAATCTVFLGVTFAWLSIVFFIACFVSDLGAINALDGAVLGSLIGYIIPGIMAFLILKLGVQGWSKCEFGLAIFLVFFGIICMVIGVPVTLFPPSGN